MATNAEFLSDALRLIGVLPENQPATAEQAENARRMLDDMMADWQAQEIDIGWTPIDDLTAECDISPSDRQAVKYNLAVRLYGIYPTANGLRPDVVAIAQAGYDRLLSTSLEDRQVEIDMTHLPLGYNRSNILTG